MVKKINTLPTSSVVDSTLGLIGDPSSGALSSTTYLALKSYFGEVAGVNGNIQFNNSGSFGADSNLSWTGRLLIGSTIDDGTSQVQISCSNNPQLALYQSSDFYTIFQTDNQGNLNIVPVGGGGGILINSFVYVNQSLYLQNFLTWGSVSSFASIMNGTVNGNITLYDSTLSTFNLLQFGGSTTSYPAIKKSGSMLSIRLADDSLDADFSARKLFVQVSPTSSILNNCFENDGTNLYFTIGGVKKVVSLV